MPSALPLSSAAPAVLDALENAGRLIDRHLQEDRCYPDLSDLLSVPTYNSPSLSGMVDMDYPLQGPGLVSFPNLPEISNIRRVPLPPELVEQFSHMQCNCMMGVFPEIAKAWLTIDSDIFMWNYEDGGDLAYFDGLSETILAVGLVRPKPDIFQPHIHYLLVLTTPVDIVILGVSFPASPTGVGTLNDSHSGGMQLLPDPLYSIPTDNTYLLAVTATDTGRIFLAGKDGCLYEIAYQAEAGWFSQRCSKINHSKSSLSFLVPAVLHFTFSEDDPIVQIAIDNSRNILYTRSERGVLQAYTLGQDGHGMSRVASLSHNAIVTAAGNIARTIDRSVFKPIVHIAVIERSESVHCHLLAVTHSGVRLYFTTSPFRPQPQSPSVLLLVHVRLPPGFSASAISHRPSHVHKALYTRGVLLLAASENDDNDSLWCISHDSFPFQRPLMEVQTTVEMDGHSWALATIDEFPVERIVTPLNRERVPPTHPPLVTLQHCTPPRRFVLLTAQGCHFFHKLRPVDQLRHILVTNGCGDGEEIERFFKLHREDQACATCLILACSSASYDREVAAWATRAFFRYGGEAQMRFPSAIPQPTNVGPIFSPSAAASPVPVRSLSPTLSRPGTPAPPVPVRSLSPTLSRPGTPGAGVRSVGFSLGLSCQSPPSPGPEVLFSGKHNGVCLYFTRILGNVWDGSIVVERTVMHLKRQVTVVETSVSPQALAQVLVELDGLRDFLDSNSQFSSGYLSNTSFSANVPQRLLGFLCPDGGSQQVQQELQRKYHTEAQAYEKASLQSLQQLLHVTCQTLALWKLLCDHQLNTIVSDLHKELQDQLKSTSLRELVLRGRELCGGLITALINRYIGDKASVTAISQHLRDTCPLLYSSQDAVCSKANELLQSSRQTQNKVERERCLRESLRLYQEISHQLDLSSVCAQYRQVGYYQAVAELCLAAAEKRDPQGLGPHYYRNEEPEDNPAGREAFLQRLSCYKCVTDSLQELVNQSKAAPQSPSVPKMPGPPVMSSDPNMLSNEEATQHFEQTLSLAQKSTDELFNIALFNWLLQADLTDKLLEVNSPYLEPYLLRMARQEQSTVRYMDLLWRYYEKNRNFSNAARILARLADIDSTEVTLQQRIEYISRAILNAKSSPAVSSQPPHGEFLHELEEKMEVARIQLLIQETLIRNYCLYPSVQDAINQLHTQLLDITKLYGEFADHFRLAECKLAIIHCAGHSDPILVQTLWQEIVEKELSDSGMMNPVDRMRTVSLKLVSLGKLYSVTPRYFPLEYLVLLLEQQVCVCGFDAGLVIYTMQEIGTSLPRLLQVYNQLFKTRDPCWQRMKKPLHLLAGIHLLLCDYIQDPSKVPAHDRRSFTNTCLDAISHYLVELQAMTPTSALQTTISNFKSLQAKLERLH